MNADNKFGILKNIEFIFLLKIIASKYTFYFKDKIFVLKLVII